MPLYTTAAHLKSAYQAETEVQTYNFKKSTTLTIQELQTHLYIYIYLWVAEQLMQYFSVVKNEQLPSCEPPGSQFVFRRQTPSLLSSLGLKIFLFDKA